MVLIVKKIIGKRADIVLIPKRVLNYLFETHVDRIHLGKGRLTTCIVSSRDDWTGKPNSRLVVKLLLETLNYQRILPGKNRYPIPHHLFQHLKCRDFDQQGRAASSIFEGDFVIELIRLSVGIKNVIREAEKYDRIGIFERGKIKKTLENIKCDKEFIFVAHHAFPARRR